MKGWMMSDISIGGYIMTKNGKTGFLEAAVNSLADMGADICVLDNDSDDGTLEFLEDHDDVDIVLQDDRSYTESAADMRQDAFYTVTDEFDPDFVVALDDDEQIIEPLDMVDFLNKFKRVRSEAVIGVMLYHLWNRYDYRVDGTWFNDVARPIIRDRTVDVDNHEWRGEGGHCTRIPVNGGKIYFDKPVIHYGWRYKDDDKRVAKMEAKMERDKVQNPKLFDMDIQQRHYNSIYEEPVLEEVPDKWKDRIVDGFKDDQVHEVTGE